jgi:hypothetical protein
MFSTRRRTVATLTAVLETGIAGWYLGHGVLWVVGAVAVVALADCTLGVVRRGAAADLVGLGMVAVLVLAAVAAHDALLTAAAALACAAWLVRPARQAPAVRPAPVVRRRRAPPRP